MSETLQIIDVFVKTLSILISPFIGIRLQKFMEERKDRSKRKENIFRTLMATRATRLSPEHVQALNMIELEFSSSGKDQAVRAAWNEYRDHLGIGHNKETVQVWNLKVIDLFIDLLHSMSQSVSLPFAKTELRNGIYFPTAHGELERDQDIIRKGLVALFSNEFSLPVTVPTSDDDLAKQNELRQAMMDMMNGVRPCKVEIVTSASSTESPKMLEGPS